MQVTLADGSTVACNPTPFAEGGDGILFFAVDGHHVIKLYKNPEPWRIQAMDAILNQYNAVREHPYWESLFAWPNALVIKPTLGIRMVKIENQRPLNNFVNPKFRMKRLTPQQRGSWQGYAAALIRVARLVRRLHNLGLCHSDLSENNLFINPVNGQATLLDCDGLVVPGVLPPPILGTKWYMAPELVQGLAKPSIQTDLHALAVIIYRTLFIFDPLRGPKKHHNDPMIDDILMYGKNALFIEHPADQSNRPSLPFPSIELLGIDMQKLFLQAFVEGLHNPTRRPTAMAWERALLRMYDQLVPCPNPACEFKSFVLRANAPQCPWCGTKLKNPQTIPFLHLYKKVGKSWSRDGNYTIVGHPGRTIHAWHVNPAKLPGPDVDMSVLAHINYQSDRWYFNNHTLDDIRIINPGTGSQPLTRSTQVELLDGQQILFGDPDQFRVAFVQIQHLA